VQKATLGPKAQPSAFSVQQKNKQTKKPGADKKNRRIVSWNDLGRMIKIRRPHFASPIRQSSVALHEQKHARHTSSP
jgi:cytochrome c556